MNDIYYNSPNQISESVKGYTHVYPKYGKSTTDPTYYEPAATRIANMKKSSGIILEGIYDYYSKDDVSKFNEENFKKNIGEAMYDPRYNSTLLPEEVSQVANNYAESVDKMVSDKKAAKDEKSERIKESVETSKAIQNSQKTSTEE